MSRQAHTDAPQTDALTRILYDMVAGQIPTPLVKGFLRYPYNLAARVQQAPGYVQPNGFLTFKLGGIGGDHLLRLHYWPEGLPESSETAGIHDHVFDFTSLVIGGGAMINTGWQVRPDAASPDSLYEVDYTDPDHSRLIRLAGRFSGAATASERVAPDSYYTVRAGEFHTSRIENNQEAITLIATKLGPDRTRPRFLSTSRPNPDYVRPPLTQTHRDRLLSQLRKVL